MSCICTLQQGKNFFGIIFINYNSRLCTGSYMKPYTEQVADGKWVVKDLIVKTEAGCYQVSSKHVVEENWW